MPEMRAKKTVVVVVRCMTVIVMVLKLIGAEVDG